jgi:hypothetical protein
MNISMRNRIAVSDERAPRNKTYVSAQSGSAQVDDSPSIDLSNPATHPC